MHFFFTVSWKKYQGFSEPFKTYWSRDAPTGFNIQQLYALPNTVFMCFVFIWVQTATCATYSINWLVFMTEMKSVYSAVRSGSLNRAVYASSLNGYLRTNSDLCHLQHKLIGFYNPDEKCLQRGTDWVYRAVCSSSLNGYLRTNSDLCHLQHKLIGFYNRDQKFLQRGTDWVFK